MTSELTDTRSSSAGASYEGTIQLLNTGKEPAEVSTARKSVSAPAPRWSSRPRWATSPGKYIALAVADGGGDDLYGRHQRRTGDQAGDSPWDFRGYYRRQELNLDLVPDLSAPKDEDMLLGIGYV